MTLPSPAPSRASSEEPDDAVITERLQALAREAQASRTPYIRDDSERYGIFCRAISNVLSTELALFTLAQIIDGLPTADVAWDKRASDLDADHPIEEHSTLCPVVMDRAREFRQSSDPDILSFDPKLLRPFQQAPKGSRLFNIRLIEMVAVAVHDIGAFVFQLDLRMHQGDIKAVEQWTNAPPDSPWAKLVATRPTLFYHAYYFGADVYPRGVADMVGYWAENRILGGVTVFDRQAEERAPESPPNVYFSSIRARVSVNYYQLVDDQQQALLDFLLAENPDECQSPLPILGDERNRVKVDFERAIDQHI
ncbi:hypothetical protein C8A03DRAFT_47754 [Achaetomium macrosporum]|uniref:Uncharacterized protein n=1 Tax=Achaetomium macrosporum TaxID=79813 RepID=A0AAN7C1T2_9PEZI|nr:hypothetical protein C8A03DRAFT_47754 [Achaetomium macrosporum]